jgi:hypothetical protein
MFILYIFRLKYKKMIIQLTQLVKINLYLVLGTKYILLINN